MNVNGDFAASYLNLRRKRKFRRLVRATGLCEAMVKGALQFLWEYSVCQGNKDKLDFIDDEDIAEQLGLPKDIAPVVFEEMINVGFIDRTDDGLVLHDFEENKNPYLTRLENERVRRERHSIKKQEKQEMSYFGDVEMKRNKINDTARQRLAPQTTRGRSASANGGGDRKAQIEAFREQLLANVANATSATNAEAKD